MPSSARQYDDDVLAATSDASSPTPTRPKRTYDNDVVAASKTDPTKPDDRVGWAEENLAGPSEILLNGLANIPYGVAHSGLDMYRRIFSDPSAPDPSIVRALRVPMGQGGAQLLSDIAEIPGVKQGGELLKKGDRALETVSPTAHDLVHQTAGVASDVANLSPIGWPVAKVGSAIDRGIASRAAANAPRSADLVQSALNDSVARSGTNMGAAATAPDISRTSQPLRSAIDEMSEKGTKPVNVEAVRNHVKADEFGVELTAGQATGDEAQLNSEFNTRNQNPAFAERKSKTNQKLIDGINGIKEDQAPAAAVDHEANAQTVIDAYKDKYAPIAADARARWEKFQEAAGGALPLETGDFTAQVGAALKKSGKTRYLPGEVAADIKDIDDGEPFTIERWDNLKTNLAAAQRKAERSGDGNAGLAISAARDAVENYQFPNLDPKLQALNADARAATARKYAMLRADPAMDAAVNDGVTSTPEVRRLSPEAKGYMERYFLRGTKADLENAQANLADNPDAKGAISGSVINELKKSAGIDPYRNDGNFSQSGYNTRLNELWPRIKYLMDPDAADKAFRLGDVARIVQRQPTGLAYNNSGTSVVAQTAKRVESGAAKFAEHAANTAGGKFGLSLGTGVRKGLEDFRNSKWVEDSLKPGAGIDRVPK